MKNQDLSFTFLVDRSPGTCFRAINNVCGWWSETVEGGTEKSGDEFIYRHKDMHYSVQKLTEVIENKKVVWRVTDSHLSFLTHKTEWTGTEICFEISPVGDQTQIRFTHRGLTPGVECFDACSNGWAHYLEHSLLSLITTGKGHPDKKEDKVKDKSEAAG